MSYTAEPKQQDTNIKVPLISKIAYGMGDVGCNFSWMFVGNFLMIFYTDVCGISMAAVSLLMLVSRFWDAINDPVIGVAERPHPFPLGTLPSMAAVRRTGNCCGARADVLGAPHMVRQC